MQHFSDHNGVRSPIDKIIQANVGGQLGIAVVAKRSHAAILREEPISLLRPAWLVLGAGVIAAIAVFVGAAAAKVQSVIAFVESPEVVSAVGINNRWRRRVARAFEDLQRR